MNRQRKKLDASPFLVALEAASGESYLGDPKFVEAALRQFALDAANRCRVEVDAAGAYRTDVAAAEKMADIFLGENSAYTPMLPWNSPGQIDVFVAEQVAAGLECFVLGYTPKQTMTNTFLLLTADVHSMIQCAGENSDPDGWKKNLDASLENFKNILLGISISD